MTPTRLLLFASSALFMACTSPVGIVEEAIDAADRGDRDAYIACFTERSRPLLRAFYNVAEVHNPALAQIGQAGAKVSEVTPLETPGSEDAKVHVRVSEGEAHLDLVVRSSGGAWRIDLIDSERFLTTSNYRF
mgnify:CR=1 FL=1